MELQALLVLCGLGVAGVAVVLLMGLFSTSGTSYEEAIAQQRRATTELLALAEGKNKPKKNNKKANKKQAKKEKKEAAVTTGSEPDSEAPAESGVEDEPAAKPHVEFSPPVVVDVSRDTPPNVKIRKRGKDPKVKPILLNKEDPSCVSDPTTPSPPPLNHFEEMHPKDEFELMHSALAAEKVSEKKEEVVEKKEAGKGTKAAKGGKAAKQSAPAPEPVKEEPARERRNSGDAPKEQRSGKAKKVEKKPVPEEVVAEEPEEVVPPLNAPQPSELTTDKLLKQVVTTAAAATTTATATTASPPGGKNKKKKPEPNVLSLMAAGDGGGVNVGELVRVVRGAALSRTEIQILTDALLNKHHDPLPEHSEWTEGPNDPMQKLKKQLADKEKALADEIEASQALHAKLKELRATLNSERGRAAAGARAAEAAAAAARAELHTLQARLQRLADDNHALAGDKLLLQSKLAAEGEAQAQRVQLDMHIQRLSESEGALMQQLAAQQADLNARVMEISQARCDAAAARDSMMIAQQHATELAQQLQEANLAYAELEHRMQQASVAEQRAQGEARAAQERLAALAELQAELQRGAAAADAALQRAAGDADRHQQQLSSELASLKEQLALRESELAELKQMKAAPAQNGLPPANDQLKAAELAKVESVVEALRGELAAAQSCSRDQAEQLARLQDQLAHYQDKNNELRTKNWKVMEALQSAEKALQTKASALPAPDSLREAIAKAQEAQYNEVASVLRSVCPSAAPGSSSGKEWLQTFADNLKKELEKRDVEKKQLEKKAVEKRVELVEAAPDSRLTELAAQNEHLQGLVDKYKRIIDDTEGVLSRLQQNVTTEEQRWAQQLADKQRELDELRQRTVLQMQKKIDALQEELEQAKAGNHNNHSFADSERLAEERLMLAGLSNKQSADLSNGPLQVELQEK
ncbi:ribosome-binding protein 1 isoform X3 [Pectinophora gossypiella]|uniref:ribosome-binding protein 1 isoform X3 n=1 Tax=Pectinophora gossypiella TaxID=13191 RepID=UPI00214E9EE3|nr:ribosome-binding protein 1 isoform X3 [Pectinophora gossypiella]